MMVLDNFRIDPPYDRVSVLGQTTGPDAGLDRVVKVVGASLFLLFLLFVIQIIYTLCLSCLLRRPSSSSRLLKDFKCHIL